MISIPHPLSNFLSEAPYDRQEKPKNNKEYLDINCEYRESSRGVVT